MDEITHDDGFTVAGIALRTSNDVAATTIPPLWQRFWEENVLASIPNRVADDLFAVYTTFEHEGIDNSGEYTLIIGARVHSTDGLPPSLVAASVPASDRVRFQVANNDMTQVPATWETIWARTDLRKTFVADYEHYAADGTITIMIGVHPE